MKLETYLIALLTLISACSLFNGKESDKEPVARVYDSYLYKSDIRIIIPQGISYQDSISLSKSYMDNWIRQHLILHKAELNLIDKSRYIGIEKQLQDYRNSLINYAYKKELIRQKLDTVVTDKEIEDYYVDFKIKDSASPLSFEKDNIGNIILNRRKLKLIKKMEESVYQDALANNDFEIY